jgi:hypothetical protein
MALVSTAQGVSMKYTDLPAFIPSEWLTEKEMEQWHRHPGGEILPGHMKAASRYLSHHRGDDFPTDAKALDQWVDSSGTCWSFYPNNGWLNMNIRLTTGELVYKEG